MLCQIWVPGTNQDLDQSFDHLRQLQYNNRQDLLWGNYTADAFRDCLALTIFFNAHNEPEVCSSIAKRDVWPGDVYRICNRFWKPNNRLKGFNRELSTGFVETVRAQIKWLESNTDCRLYFISRSTIGWQRHLSTKLNQTLGINFAYDKYRYQTCDCASNDSCWQSIIYAGDTKILESWPRRSSI